MFPLRSHHLVSRTQAGEKAWHEVRLPPSQRKLLGLLRQPLAVSELLQAHDADPGVIEELVWASARDGYLRVDILEPSPHPEPQVEPVQPEPDVDQDKALQDLLDRHRPSPPQAHRQENQPAPAPVDTAPSPPSAESVAALSRALAGHDTVRRDHHGPAPRVAADDDDDDGMLIKSSADLMRALMGEATPAAEPAMASGPADELPRVEVDAPYANPQPADPKAQREDTFLRITRLVQSRHGPAEPDQSHNRPARARGENDVAYAARLQAIAKHEALEEQARARRAEMAERRRQEKKEREGNTREGLADRLKKALSQREAGKKD